MTRTATADVGYRLANGVLAGLAGSAALDVVTYADMVLRGRPASGVPQETAGRLTRAAHLRLGPEDRAANRRAGLGPILGHLSGVATAAGYAVLIRRRLPLPAAAVLLGIGAMFGTDAPIAALRVSDPRTWRLTDWVSDIVPHLVFGSVAAATLDRV